MDARLAEGAPESPATSSQISPLLRQRMLNRAATFSEGAQSSRPLDRRRSSTLSDLSDTRQSFTRPVKDSDALQSLDEPTFWYSAPLAFAILPAVGGLFFQNGNGFVTDILLLVLGAMFLNWCVRAPWYVYSSSYTLSPLNMNQGLVSCGTTSSVCRDRR